MNKEDVAKILLDIKAVSLKTNPPFTWASGIKSPIYCDNRLILSYPDERQKIVDAFLETIEKNNLKFDVVAGVATSGIPWASMIALKINKPLIYIRDKAKEHGKSNQIEGKLEKGQKVILIEDLISTGGSSFSVVEAIREAGGIVEDCIAIFTYEFEKANKKFEEGKCNLHVLSNITALLKTAHNIKYIDDKNTLIIADFFKNPQEWGAKHSFDKE